MAHLRFNISGMTGRPCQEKIESRLAALPGIYSAIVCLDRGYADIEFGEDRVSADDLVQEIQAAGYTATIGG